MVLVTLDSAYKFKFCRKIYLSTSDGSPYRISSQDQSSLLSAAHMLVYHITKNWLDSQNSIPLSSKTETEVPSKGTWIALKGTNEFSTTVLHPECRKMSVPMEP